MNGKYNVIADSLLEEEFIVYAESKEEAIEKLQGEDFYERMERGEIRLVDSFNTGFKGFDVQEEEEAICTLF